jgi:hypothetical protein
MPNRSLRRKRFTKRIVRRFPEAICKTTIRSSLIMTKPFKTQVRSASHNDQADLFESNGHGRWRNNTAIDWAERHHLSDHLSRLLVAIAGFANKEFQCWPPQKQLAERSAHRAPPDAGAGAARDHQG